jgi:ssDNA-binding Zn-finger/Zn-ribbon topoisomerase 1
MNMAQMDSIHDPRDLVGGIPPAPKAEPPRCPLCRAPMKKAFSQKTQKRFFGCARYPRCPGTRPFTFTKEQLQPRHSTKMSPTREFTWPGPTKTRKTVTVVCEGSGPALEECPF